VATGAHQYLGDCCVWTGSFLNFLRLSAEYSKVSSKALQRGIVIAMILATVGGALAAYFVSRHNLHSARTDRVETAQQSISDALRRRAYYLEDIGDMVGVHDDADEAEFSRWAHVRGRNEGAIVSVEWVRRSPTGELVPPHDIGPHPILVAPTDARNAALANALSHPVAAGPLRLSELHKQVAISQPVKLANGDEGFYMSIPVVSHLDSGEISHTESQSAIVGLIDAQQLVAEALPVTANPTALQLRDQVTPLATIGSGLNNAVRAAIATPGRAWTVSVAGGSLTTSETLLPWLILLIGGALTFTVAYMLRTLARRRDAALELASERSEELAASLEVVEQANRDLERARADAEQLSREDPVTGIFNRRHFGEVLARELSNPEGGGIPAVLLLDLDHFKQVNDEHGHLMGDAVLQTVTDRIASVLREEDCLARWGGEEFAVLAPDIDRDGVVALAERAREALAREPVQVGDVSIDLTLSAGAALATTGQRTPDTLVHAADQALYDAKDAGRNCVRIWDADAAPSGVSAP
jgi:diguanylate cyclase (GGDEF)-like protein